jgi:hypothetical protein
MDVRPVQTRSLPRRGQNALFKANLYPVRALCYCVPSECVAASVLFHCLYFAILLGLMGIYVIFY